MNNTTIYSNEFGHKTIFAHSEHSIWLTRLWDIECGLNGTNSDPVITRGICVLETDSNRYEGEAFSVVEFQSDDHSLQLSWKVGNSGLLWKSHWQLHSKAGIWNRRDRLENRSHSTIIIRRCLARIPFAADQYDLYTQASNWARENQGYWNEFFGSRLTLCSRSGRTTQIANPYLFLHETNVDHGIAFHILPRGNWTIHVDRTSTTRDERFPFNVVKLGLSDNSLYMQLPAGGALNLPEILIQDVPSRHPETGSASLHLYLFEKYIPNQKIAPVVYNTWFDRFEDLNIDHLHAQLVAAKEIGCEVFTVDAGWYGVGKGNWHSLVGDWREKPNGAFFGQMASFADRVRSVGLGFGLWVEPERNHAEASIVKAHPDWFLPGFGGFFYPDLSQPAAYNYILAELSRLIETYQLAWMKVDFNFELGDTADEFSMYFERWYQLLDELRQKYPNTFFEGCASGGMRLDLNTLTHFDGHFLSDAVNPVDVLRISQAAMLRLPPGQIAKWAVLRADHDEILTPGGASWNNAILADVDFVCRAALPGMFGLSGDLTGLSAEAIARVRQHIDFYKQWREFIRGHPPIYSVPFAASMIAQVGLLSSYKIHLNQKLRWCLFIVYWMGSPITLSASGIWI